VTRRGEGRATTAVSVLDLPSGSRAGGGRLGGRTPEGSPWRSRTGEDRRQGGAQEEAAIVDVLLHRLADVEVLEEAETGRATLLHRPATPPCQIRTSEA
jgi:hypothetical protein